MDDIELLREYALRHSEEAFATLVSRHINLVYAAAWRQVGNHHHAEEITQAVFIILARKAKSFGPGTVLPAWLFRTARLTAANHLRTEVRRAHREQEAFMQSNPNDAPDLPWEQIAPVLNDVIDGLREKDRSAIVLRFLQGKDYTQVAAALGTTEEAAQMRVHRAIEKMRKLFGKKGIVASTTLLGGLLTTNGVQAAPDALAQSITAAAITKGAAASASTLTLVKGALKVMAWSKTKTTALVAVGILLAGGGITTAILLAKAKANAKALAYVTEDPVASRFRNESPVDASKLRQQLVGNWALETKRLGVDKDYTHYADNNRRKTWTLTNWAIVRYDERSNIVYSASGPYELQGDHYTETVEKATGLMTSYIGTKMKFRIRVEGDKYYQTALGDKPSLQEIGHRLP